LFRAIFSSKYKNAHTQKQKRYHESQNTNKGFWVSTIIQRLLKWSVFYVFWGLVWNTFRWTSIHCRLGGQLQPSSRCGGFLAVHWRPMCCLGLFFIPWWGCFFDTFPVSILFFYLIFTCIFNVSEYLGYQDASRNIFLKTWH
jgi:hypothetical protein